MDAHLQAFWGEAKKLRRVDSIKSLSRFFFSNIIFKEFWADASAWSAANLETIQKKG